MYRVPLPISKSIANRLLILQALQGKSDWELPADNVADDVRLLHDILQTYLRHTAGTALTFDCCNCGTAMRFLTAFFASQQGANIVLTGSERMQQRPIGQEVDALRSIGAAIEYLGKEGFPPLHIVGERLQGGEVCIQQPQSTQFVSALMLISDATEHGITVHTGSRSPYIEMTKQLIETARQERLPEWESDWSAAAFWYEYVAIHGGQIFFPRLQKSTLQGDNRVADIFARYFGVVTGYTPDGVSISKTQEATTGTVNIDFTDCPDLYPAIRMTCYGLQIPLHATGTESLPLKESDRLAAFEQLQNSSSITQSRNSPVAQNTCSSYHDHRIAMAFMAAGLPVDDTDCVSKSYPHFAEQLYTISKNDISLLIPFRNISKEAFPILPADIPVWLIDDHSEDNSYSLVLSHYKGRQNIRIVQSPYPQGKKHALHYGMEQATTTYVRTTDFDIALPDLSLSDPLTADLYILPLRMKQGSRLIEKLQVTEYAALQALTLWTAERKHAIMCSGANLIVRREQWLQSFNALHTQLLSGDDMFLLEDFKRRGLNVQALPDSANAAIAAPQPTLRALLHQRMRWAGKAPAYTDKDIRLSGTIVVLLNLLSVCPPVWLIKFACEYYFLRKAHEYNLITYYSWQFLITLLLSLLYPWYMLICLIGGLLKRKRW